MLGHLAYLPQRADARLLHGLGVAGQHEGVAAFGVLEQEFLILIQNQRLAGKHGRADKEIGFVDGALEGSHHVEIGLLAHGRIERSFQLRSWLDLQLGH